MIRALAVTLFLLPYIPIASFFGYLVARLARSPAVLYALGRFGVRVALALAGTRIAVKGGERLGDPANTVIMPNHVSHLDAPVLLQALRVDIKAVAKIELFRIPFFNWCLRYAGFIAVDRKDRPQATEAISRAARSLRSGNCFLIFPEGTRSRTGELGEFKKGAFVVAMEAGSRIVPVALRGTRELMPKGGFRIRPGTVTVEVLEPVWAGGYSYDDRDRLISIVRSRVAAALSAERPAPEKVEQGA